MKPDNAGEGSGKIRRWSEDDLFRVLLIHALRKKFIGLKRVRLILKKLPLEKMGDFTALIVTRRRYILASLEDVASFASAEAGPVTVICTATLLATIRSYKIPDHTKTGRFASLQAFQDRTGLFVPSRSQ